MVSHAVHRAGQLGGCFWSLYHTDEMLEKALLLAKERERESETEDLFLSSACLV